MRANRPHGNKYSAHNESRQQEKQLVVNIGREASVACWSYVLCLRTTSCCRAYRPKSKWKIME